MPLHKNLTATDIHTPFGLGPYADAAARLAAVPVAADVGKLAFQSDDSTIWVLLNHSPLTWKQVTPDGLVASTLVVDVVCLKGTAGTINKGQVIYITGYDVPLSAVKVELAKADSTTTMPVLGIATEPITDTVAGKARVHGELKGLDTSGMTVNDCVHASATTAGAFTPTHTAGPGVHQVIAKVAKVDATTGVLVCAVTGDYDHLSNSAPQPLGTADPGISAFISRQNHVHAHGDQAGGTLHPNATTSVAGFESAADKTKLDGLVSNKLLQAAHLALSSDFSTSSTTFVTLLTTNITVAANSKLMLWAHASGDVSGPGWASIRVTVDGTVVAPASNCHGHSSNTTPLTMATSGLSAVLGAGARTVVLQVKTSGITFTAAASTTPEQESAAITIQEIAP